ncbi:hypothetical protein [Flavobacterium sharifuzzamanii]|uniref:hypothetical protein n=1 Tax=Flavobacterium sharifuzzamanii TaxID=2211133 RepID=UPI000DABFA2D|nr:hypothetical protein [Flavobacterium sharifuzzamanii]KAF2079161.1 hypothetical protein DMA14_22030 [Flavobacterium sharifuzzamanii]
MILKNLQTLRIFLFLPLMLLLGFSAKSQKNETNLVKSNKWFIAGPALENEEEINKTRLEKGIVAVTAKDNPKGEIELNVMITPSEINDGVPTNLPDNSKLVEITYQSTQIIKLQAREGNKEGTGCVHGGSHPRVTIPASPKHFSTIKIPWSDFRQDELSNGKLLNIHNLCKFNFVNYNPVSGSVLKIKSVIIF